MVIFSCTSSPQVKISQKVLGGLLFWLTLCITAFVMFACYCILSSPCVVISFTCPLHLRERYRQNCCISINVKSSLDRSVFVCMLRRNELSPNSTVWRTECLLISIYLLRRPAFLSCRSNIRSRPESPYGVLSANPAFFYTLDRDSRLSYPDASSDISTSPYTSS